jgi:hypothetical protein
MQHANPILREELLLNLAGSLSVTAALIHAMVMPEHFREWWGYGSFFFVVTLAQTIYGVGLVLRAWGIRPVGAFQYIWEHQARTFYVAGIVGNIAIVALYAITRTGGIPLGPEAGEIETFNTISITSKVLEIALIGCLMLLLAASRNAATISEEI